MEIICQYLNKIFRVGTQTARTTKIVKPTSTQKIKTQEHQQQQQNLNHQHHPKYKMPINKVVILRHGESEFNKLNLFCGWHDAPLTEKGLEDALKIAVTGLRLHNMQFDFIYTSLLQRAHQTVNVIKKEMNYENVPVIYDWRLNERHYGNLTGFNKRQVANKYGEEKVQIWRRSFDVLPPPITPDNPYYDKIRNNPKFKDIPKDQFPDNESLKTLMLRTVPLWENEIMPKVLKGQKVLIVAHGTVVRALMKYIEDISDEDIMKLNIPNSVPCVYQYDMELGMRVDNVQYLADEDYVKRESAKVASIGN
ncbi:2,3-bisphosphoglycerate-dependent phosphoglycerate mutase-like isoform X1 [Lucilia cuprina]|uniref:2,3-bisphosphoglycerate-dependent phosphoglycerate mutase-like isoform X1 n=1 Tax=Lucilia cuprina TaxID=7375 RepID=UPI001F051AA1|nr:2,3-bisphosphoglycerate-dependent phosphoglycerate mutase-like isoform X1 [Lucilia cuprina]